MEIIITKADKEQTLDILYLNKSVWYQAYKDIVEIKEIDKHFKQKLSIDGIKRFENYIDKCDNFYVAKLNDKIIGYIDFGMCKWDPKYKDYGEIYAIYVSPEYQRGGVGLKLLNFAMDYFKSNNIHDILLTTFKKNIIGLSFYKKNNFFIKKEFPKGSWNNNSVDEVLLCKKI